jgi:hypothetical protein
MAPAAARDPRRRTAQRPAGRRPGSCAVSPWWRPSSAADELLLQEEVDRTVGRATSREPAATRLLSVKNWPCRLLSDEVIGRLSPVTISTSAQKKSL